MGRIHGLIKYAILLITIPGVILFVHPPEASSSEQSDLFNQQVIEFPGLVSAFGDGRHIQLAQNREEGDEDSPESLPSEKEEAFPDEDFPDSFPEDDLPLDEAAGISDPLEPINRAFFVFNDKMYFWVLKPIASGYRYVAPEPVRVGIGNFFYNLAFPIRFVNCALQGKVFEASEEIRRFVINTTAGAAGFIDVATNHSKIKKYDEDLGQTFGLWGIGPGFYINWPILGPSTFRDTFGFVGDAFLYPVSFLFDPSVYTLAINGFDIVNQTSLRIGDYEDLKKAAFDPYIALRDAYYQNRRSKIEQ